MKNKFSLILFGFISFLLACESKKDKEPESLLLKYQAKKHADSIIKQIKHDAMFDTVGLWNAPVKVLSAKIVQEEYSSYKSVQLKYKNVSGKNIAGIKFKWYGVNVFGEPADLGSYVSEGFGAGFTDDLLKSGRTVSGTWEVLSRDAKKINLAWSYEIIYQDGSKWEMGEK